MSTRSSHASPQNEPDLLPPREDTATKSPPCRSASTSSLCATRTSMRRSMISPPKMWYVTHFFGENVIYMHFFGEIASPRFSANLDALFDGFREIFSYTLLVHSSISGKTSTNVRFCLSMMVLARDLFAPLRPCDHKQDTSCVVSHGLYDPPTDRAGENASKIWQIY